MHISQNNVLITAVKFLIKAIAFFIVGKLIDLADRTILKIVLNTLCEQV